jgi:hypothetical protein
MSNESHNIGLQPTPLGAIVKRRVGLLVTAA